MKRLGFALRTIVGAAGLVWSFNFYANAAGSAKDEIIAVEKQIIAATTTDQLMDHIDEKEFVLYDFTPPLQYKGANELRAHFDEFFNTAKDVKGEFVELVVVADGTLGIARSIQHFAWRDKEGKLIEGTWRFTDVFHKVDGKWKLIHMHLSVPVDPATEKGQMNLKP